MPIAMTGGQFSLDGRQETRRIVGEVDAAIASPHGLPGAFLPWWSS